MRTPSRSATPRAAQRGLTIVELLVGAAIGLLVVAAGTTLLTGQLRESRGLLLEARLMQDLRTAADLVSRDLRRAGYWGGATEGVWLAGASSVVVNPYAAVSPGAAASDAASFRYSRDATENHLVDGNEQFGYRLRAGVIELQLGAGNWQALTDSGTLNVTEFSVTPFTQDISLQGFCATDCPAGSSTCPPRQQVRSLALVISGRGVVDARVTRSIRSEVRLRNDPITGACAA
jgi:prepilin peptidase dependent protein B